ncbi:MAG: NAD(+) diphosphatase [Nocardioides sp.]|nr:NAD(+) diphosphatase [Nocardioides sp.]
MSPHQQIALSVRAHERIAGRRTDEAWTAEMWADPRTRVLVLAGTSMAPEHSRRWCAPGEAPEGARLLLGEQDGIVHFAVVAEEAAADDDWVFLRVLVQDLEEAEADLLIHAVALAEWHRAHRFCGRCGGVFTATAGGHVLTCGSCGRDQFPRTDPAVIMLVTDGPEAERALLGRHPQWPEGRFSTLAGFVEPGESMEDAVRREVAEEVGVTIGPVTYFGNQPWPFPASLMIGFVAEATSVEVDVDGEEIEAARWFTREEMKAEAEAGTLVLPGGISISRSLIEDWYGGPLPGRW